MHARFKQWMMLSLIAGGHLTQAFTVPRAAPPPIRKPEAISYFGERAAWSADGKKLAFMDKSYGDAFEMDMETRHITLLTHYSNPGYLRVQYLNNDDLFLIGAPTYEGEDQTRDALQEMWVLKHGSMEPVRLNHKIWEGVAISRKKGSTKIAWANKHDNYPDRLSVNESAIYTGDVVSDDNGVPTLTNVNEIIRAMRPDCTLEPQDFFADDTHLAYTCYNNTVPQTGSVRGIDLETGDVTVYRFVPGEYNEVEGLTPDGKYAMIESSKDQAEQAGNAHLDIWRLRLEPDSSDFVRITDFGDNPVNGANKASNPVVSPDGKTMAFQGGHSGDAAGVGYGLFLVNMPGEN